MAMAATRITEAIMEATGTTAVPITAATRLTGRTGIIHTAISAAIMVRITRTIPTALSTVATTDRLLLRAYRKRLARAGYYAGRINGVMGPRTRYATRAYERRHGLPAYGVIDRRLLTTMGVA